MNNAGIDGSTSGGWRTFDALDLERKKQNPLKGRLRELDLKQRSKSSANVVARKVSDYNEKTAHDVIGPLFPAWSKGMPKYGQDIAPAAHIEETCDSMEAKIHGEIWGVIRGVDYNGLHVVNEFIEFYEEELKKDPKMNSVEIFQRFEPDSTSEASLTRGSTCVGKAREVVNRLERMGVEAHVVAESPEENKPPEHAAVVVPCKDGVLLIELEQLEKPIMQIKPQIPFVIPYSGLNLSFEIIETSGNYKMTHPMIVKREDFIQEKHRNSQSQYVLRPDNDPDKVMKRWIVKKETTFYPVSSAAREGKEQHAIKVNVAYKKVTFNIGEEKFRIPFNAFDLSNRTIDRDKLTAERVTLTTDGRKVPVEESATEKEKDFFFGKKVEGEGLEKEEILEEKGDSQEKMEPGGFFKAFKTSEELLIEQIFTVISHQEMLEDLRKKYKSEQHT